MSDPLLHTKPIEIPKEAIRQTLENEDEALGSRIYKSVQQSPFAAIGMLGFGIGCGIGAYKWKTRTVPVQLFLIQLRVAAQSTGLGLIAVGMTYQVYKSFSSKQKPT